MKTKIMKREEEGRRGKKREKSCKEKEWLNEYT